MLSLWFTASHQSCPTIGEVGGVKLLKFSIKCTRLSAMDSAYALYPIPTKFNDVLELIAPSFTIVSRLPSVL